MLIRHRKAFERQVAPLARPQPERRTTFRTALIYPLLKQADLAIDTLSRTGMSGCCALALEPQQSVHVSFDERNYLAADVRWVIDRKYGLRLEDPLNLPDFPVLSADRPGLEPGDTRYKVDLAARLATTDAMITASVRGLSGNFMQIESNSHLGEGETVLVRTAGQPVRRARVHWSHDSTAHLVFDHDESPIGEIL